MDRSAKIIWLPTFLMIAACGGGEPAAVEPTGAGNTAAGGDTGEAAGTAEQASPEDASAEQPEQAEPAAPQAEPIEAADADALRAALVAARDDVDALTRIIDPEMGIGAWDREENTRAHFCDSSRFAQEPNLGYELREGDDWSCNDELTRCSSVDPETRTGTVFHFREATGNGRWLSSVIRYDRRVPRYDTEEVTSWVEGAEGVCELYRTLTGEANELDPDKLSVFVSRFTEGVDDSSTDFHCGDEAVTVAREKLAPLMQAGPPTVCRREPLACAWMEATESRVYGDRGTGRPIALATLATGLREGPTRLQEREVTAFAQRAAVRRCE